MMYYFTVVICGVSLLSGIICSPIFDHLDDSDHHELPNARDLNGREVELNKLQDLETKMLAKRILTKLANENEIKKTYSETDDDESKVNEVLRELRNMLGNDMGIDLTARDSPVENENVDGLEETSNTHSKRWPWWCLWCGSKFVQEGTTDAESLAEEEAEAEEMLNKLLDEMRRNFKLVT